MTLADMNNWYEVNKIEIKVKNIRPLAVSTTVEDTIQTFMSRLLPPTARFHLIRWTIFIVFKTNDCTVGWRHLTHLTVLIVWYPACKYWSSGDLPPTTNKQIALINYKIYSERQKVYYLPLKHTVAFICTTYI